MIKSKYVILSNGLDSNVSWMELVGALGRRDLVWLFHYKMPFFCAKTLIETSFGNLSGWVILLWNLSFQALQYIAYRNMAISSVVYSSSGWMNWNFASGEIEREVEESSSLLRLLENIIFHPFMMDSRKLSRYSYKSHYSFIANHGNETLYLLLDDMEIQSSI